MRRPLIRSVILSVIQILATPALAAPVIDTGMNAAAREARLDPKVAVTGTLICEADPKTEGDTCNLELQDDNSGQVYQLKDRDAQAMQLYRAGQTSVAIQAKLQDGDTLVVQKASKL